MSTKHTDPWATSDPGFERYTGPAAADGFDPLDSRARASASTPPSEPPAVNQYQESGVATGLRGAC